MSGVQGGALFDCVGSGRQMGELMMKSLGVKTVKELEDAQMCIRDSPSMASSECRTDG